MKTKLDALRSVVAAWEHLPGDKDYSIDVIAEWLLKVMKPAIDECRKVIKENS